MYQIAINDVNGGLTKVSVLFGGSKNISCTFSGIPTPEVTWTLNDQPAPFKQTSVVTYPNFDIAELSVARVVSTLHISNTSIGEYRCTGTNIPPEGSPNNRSAIITTTILGMSFVHAIFMSNVHVLIGVGTKWS